MRKACGRLVIDDEGEPWHGQADRVKVRLGDIAAGGSFAGYAVQNLGFVDIQSDHMATVIRLRPELVKPRTLAGVYYHLADTGARRIAISHFAGEWVHEICPSLNHALARIEALCRTNAPDQRRQKDYLTARKSLRQLAEAPAHRLVPALRAWQDCEGQVDDELLGVLSRAGVLDRALAFDYVAKGDRLVVSHWGEEIGRCVNMRPLAAGEDVENAPDRNYAAWASLSYRQAMQTGEPVYEYVDAVIRPMGQQPVRRRYERLILTWRKAGGGRMVTNASVVNPDIEV